MALVFALWISQFHHLEDLLMEIKRLSVENHCLNGVRISETEEYMSRCNGFLHVVKKWLIRKKIELFNHSLTIFVRKTNRMTKPNCKNSKFWHKSNRILLIFALVTWIVSYESICKLRQLKWYFDCHRSFANPPPPQFCFRF